MFALSTRPGSVYLWNRTSMDRLFNSVGSRVLSFHLRFLLVSVGVVIVRCYLGRLLGSRLNVSDDLYTTLHVGFLCCASERLISFTVALRDGRKPSKLHQTLSLIAGDQLATCK